MRSSSIIVVLCVLVCAIVILPVIAISVRGSRDDVFAADAAIVSTVNSGVDRSGAPLPSLADRLDRAHELLSEGVCRYVIVSGAEAAAMKRYLVGKGAHEWAVIEDSAGSDTRATATAASEIIRSRGFKSAIAVTSFYHVARFVSALKAAGVETVGSTYARGFRLSDILYALREIPAVFAYSTGLR